MNNLKQLAKVATPGTWIAVDYGNYEGTGSHWYVDTQFKADIFNEQDGTISPNHYDSAREEADMKFIAAANPAAILALIAENETLRAGMKGDYDLDSWLEFVRIKPALVAHRDARISELEGLLREALNEVSPSDLGTSLYERIGDTLASLPQQCEPEWPKEQCPTTGAVRDVDPADLPAIHSEDGQDEK